MDREIPTLYGCTAPILTETGEWAYHGLHYTNETRMATDSSHSSHLQPLITSITESIRSSSETNAVWEAYRAKIERLYRKKHQTSYVNRLLRASCFEELRELFARTTNPSKEMSESVAALSWLEVILGKEGINNSVCLHVGDGGTARTGAVFAYLTRSTNYSVDPIMNMAVMEKWSERWKPQRLFATPCTVQQLQTECHAPYKNASHGIDSHVSWFFTTTKQILITAVHAHVSCIEIDKAVPRWSWMYVNPCCMPAHQQFPAEYLKAHGITLFAKGEDPLILSPNRTVLIYRKEWPNSGNRGR